jgi:glycosyltransferase 2 family protein
LHDGTEPSLEPRETTRRRLSGTGLTVRGVARRELRPIWLLAGVALSLLAGYLAVRDVDFGLFVDALAASEYRWLLPAMAALVAAFALRAIRWWSLFPPETRPPFGPIVRSMFIGEFFNSILPLRPGELVRILALHRETGASRAQAFGTTVTERLYDVGCLLLFFVVSLPFVSAPSWLPRALALLAVTCLAAGGTAMVVGRYGPRPIAFALRPLARLDGITEARTELAAYNVLQGLGGLQRLGLAATTFGLTTLSWVAVAACFWFTLRASGLELGFEAAILAVVATTFSLVLPALPTSVGVFEAAVIVALQPFDVSASQALSYAVVVHVLTFAPFIAAGAVALRGHAVQSARWRGSH